MLWVASAQTPKLRTQVVQTPNGADLVTVFASVQPGMELPLVSILRDTLGDPAPEAHRLRKVWVMTYERPNTVQRLAASLPFFFRRSSANQGNVNRPPAAVLDMSAPSRASMVKLTDYLLQTQALDGRGVFFRAPSRSYTSNADEYKRVHLKQGLEILGEVPPSDEQHGLTDTELQDIEARLSLSNRMLGGFVSNSRLPEVYTEDRTHRNVDRAHNWEVLRQRAEENGLYFEPLGVGDRAPAQAMLWISRRDLKEPSGRHYNPALLNISNPWTDARLQNWTAYTQTWYFDEDERRVSPESPQASAVEMIPLAVYALDCPKAPLLLIDFRSNWNPKKRELGRRVADTVASGVLGWNGLVNLEYFVAKKTFLWVRVHHGDAVDRSWRIDAYAQLRHTLLISPNIDPALRTEINHRLDALALNPFEQDLKSESNLASRQYAALLRWAQDPAGLGAELYRNRKHEMFALTHTRGTRTLLTLASVSTLGIYRPAEHLDTASLAELQREREIQARTEFLERVMASTPDVQVTWDSGEVRRNVNELAELSAGRRDPKVASIISQLYSRTNDAETRRDSIRCLSRLNARLEKDDTSSDGLAQ